MVEVRMPLGGKARTEEPKNTALFKVWVIFWLEPWPVPMSKLAELLRQLLAGHQV
jgi:hypothetical protein